MLKRGGYQQAALTREVSRYVTDDIEEENLDHNKYLKLSELLVELGRPEDASAVAGIASDEARHEQILTTIRSELQTGEQ